MFSLDEQVEARILKLVPEFCKWLETDEAKEFLRERMEKEEKFRVMLDRDHIDQLTDAR